MRIYKTNKHQMKSPRQLTNSEEQELLRLARPITTKSTILVWANGFVSALIATAIFRMLFNIFLPLA